MTHSDGYERGEGASNPLLSGRPVEILRAHLWDNVGMLYDLIDNNEPVGEQIFWRGMVQALLSILELDEDVWV